MNLSRYVGIPWKDRGRDEDGADCYGLIRLVYQNCLGVNLPSYTAAYVTSEDRRVISAVIAGGLAPWIEVPEGHEQPLDALLMLQAGEVCHIGLVASPGYVLHMVPRKDSVIEPYTTGKLRHRLAGFYRHEANT